MKISLAVNNNMTVSRSHACCSGGYDLTEITSLLWQSVLLLFLILSNNNTCSKYTILSYHMNCICCYRSIQSIVSILQYVLIFNLIVRGHKVRVLYSVSVCVCVCVCVCTACYKTMVSFCFTVQISFIALRLPAIMICPYL